MLIGLILWPLRILTEHIFIVFCGVGAFKEDRKPSEWSKTNKLQITHLHHRQETCNNTLHQAGRCLTVSAAKHEYLSSYPSQILQIMTTNK